MILSRYLKLAPVTMILGLVCLLLAGCGHSGTQAAVVGSVTLDGQLPSMAAPSPSLPEASIKKARLNAPT